MTDAESGEETFHTREMQLAQTRKEVWLENRGRIVTWLLEPWPVSLWLGSWWVGVLGGLFVGFLIGVGIVG